LLLLVASPSGRGHHSTHQMCHVRRSVVFPLCNSVQPLFPSLRGFRDAICWRWLFHNSTFHLLLKALRIEIMFDMEENLRSEWRVAGPSLLCHESIQCHHDSVHASAIFRVILESPLELESLFPRVKSTDEKFHIPCSTPGPVGPSTQECVMLPYAPVRIRCSTNVMSSPAFQAVDVKSIAMLHLVMKERIVLDYFFVSFFHSVSGDVSISCRESILMLPSPVKGSHPISALNPCGQHRVLSTRQLFCPLVTSLK
jgi:hypothetical protein